MSKLITASLDVTKIDKTKIIQGKKGQYLNLTIWVNDEADQFGNDVSLQQSLSKEERETGAAKIYLGNGKTYKSNEPIQGSAPAADTNTGSDLPF